MNLILLSLFCCCLLVTVTPGVDSAKFNLNQVLKRSVWLQRTKRDLSSLSALREAQSGQFVRPEDVKDALLPHSSAGHTSVRTKRSRNSVINQSKRSGCALGTCTMHDLAFRLQQLNNKLSATAPIEKIGALGYGRRRRSVPERRMTLEREERAAGRLRPVWRLHKLEALLRRT